MATGDLASLASLKAWLGITDTASDAILSALITSTSGKVNQYINRKLPMATYNEVRNGSNSQRIAMRQWPISDVTSVSVDGVIIPVSPDGLSSGYVFDEMFVYLQGIGVSGRVPVYAFTKGFQNIRINYSAGYAELDDLQTVPATPGPYTIAATGLIAFWSGDLGVKFANGTPLVKVLVLPAAGQYTVSPSGLYTFSAADQGKAVLVSYGTVPPDVQQAVIEWSSFTYRATRANIGIKSKSLAGETIVFDTGAMPASSVALLNNYRKMIPV